MIECSICLDSVGQQVITCFSGQHQFCGLCLAKYVSAECDWLHMRASTLITCPYVSRGQCSSNPFTSEWIQQHVDSVTYSKYASVVMRHRETAGPSRPAPVTVADYRVEVVELLNPSCPRCQATFIDFVGCCALSCRLCTCRFCAYCHESKVSDLHNHVMTCRYRDEENWRRGQLRWTRDRIVSLLKPLSKYDQRQVLDGCRVYLKDLPIEMASLISALGL